jgi:hypothetical protein
MEARRVYFLRRLLLNNFRIVDVNALDRVAFTKLTQARKNETFDFNIRTLYIKFDQLARAEYNPFTSLLERAEVVYLFVDVSQIEQYSLKFKTRDYNGEFWFFKVKEKPMTIEFEAGANVRQFSIDIKDFLDGRTGNQIRQVILPSQTNNIGDILVYMEENFPGCSVTQRHGLKVQALKRSQGTYLNLNGQRKFVAREPSLWDRSLTS